MSDFKKILDHPEHQKLIDRLLAGESPKDLSQYLKLKYTKPDEAHLRLGAALLSEFQKEWMQTGDFLSKIVADEKSGQLDKQISQSLLNNASWKDRITKLADEEIDIKKKLFQLLHVMEARQEQIFDKIQENPGSTKSDYVLTKYFELNILMMEKLDKIVNGTPDQKIEHTFTVQMVEEHSSAFQEAIRRVLQRMDANMASIFMDMLSEEMGKMKDPTYTAQMSIEKRNAELNKLVAKSDDIGERIDALNPGEIVEDYVEEEPDDKW